MTYITWIEESRRVVAYNDKEEILGFFEYERTGRFMHWCWHQESDIKMTPGCVEEMRLKQKELGGKK